MKQKHRLKSAKDFERVRLTGRSLAHPLVVLIYRQNNADKIRIGIAAGRSLGNAVKRNKAKRRLRAIADILLPEIEQGWDILFIARKPMAKESFDEVFSAAHYLLSKAHILKKKHVA